MKKLSIITLLLFSFFYSFTQTTFNSIIYFDSDAYILDDSGREIINNLADQVVGFNEVSLKIIGHTDLDGTDAYNMDLSKKRAESVKKFLLQNGFSASDMEIAFLGESAPVALSTDANSKRQNRRVSIDLVAYSYNSAKELVSQVESENNDEFVIETERETHLKLTKGTQVNIPSDAFCHLDGSPITNAVVNVRFKEAFDYLDMVDEGLFTQTKDKILETGGMIHIEATQDGKPLRLRDGKSIELIFPEQEMKDGMELFIGAEDEDGVIWEETGDQISSVKSKRDMPFIEVDLTPLLEVEVDEMILPSLDFAPMPVYPAVRRKPNLPFKRNYTEEGYIEAMKTYEEAVIAYEQDKIDRPERLEKWIKEASRRKEILFEHKKQYILSTTRKKVKESLARLKKDQKRISHDRLVEVLFSFLAKTVGKVEYDEWYHIKKTFGGGVVPVRNLLGLDFPMFDMMPVHYFFKNIDAAVNEIYRKIAERKYELGYVDADVLSRYIVSTSDLGWINCDRFMRWPDEMKMDLPLATLSQEDQIYLIFKNNKTLIRPSFYQGTIMFKGIPKGEDVRLVAVRVNEGNALMARKDFTIGAMDNVTMDFAAVEIKDLKRVFDIL